MKKQFRITLNGTSYDVVAEILDAGEPAQPERASRRAARSGGASAMAAPVAPKPVAASAPGDVPSPLAGKVVSVDVSIGDQLSAGDQIMTLEAMKMNTVVSSPAGGTVRAIHVSAGDAVEEGQPLLTVA
jgi:biotin carboxyl carrier protein